MPVLELGKLITLEGPEGAGKTTQANVLFRWLTEKGFKTVLTYEPGGTALGQRVRSILLGRDCAPSPMTEVMLYAADRSQHVQELIRPALREGSIVVCDRFVDSSVAYQGYARGLGEKLIRDINDSTTGGIEPDLTLLFDLPVDQGIRRKRALLLDRMELEERAFHEAVRAGYLEIARRETRRVRIIDAAADPGSVSAQTLTVVSEFLKGCGCDV